MPIPHSTPRRRAPRIVPLLALLGIGLCASAAHAARPNF